MAKHAPRGRIKAKHPMGPVDPMPIQKCAAHSKQSGQPCKRNAILGGTVCFWHGGAAPQVKRKAAERLEELRPMAIQYYDYLLNQKDYPSAGLGAANAVMDRNDGRPAETIRMEVDTRDAQLRRLDEGRARVAAAKRLISGKG